MISIKHHMDHLTESGRFTPYPNMTDDELDDFDRFADEMDNLSEISAGNFIWLLILFVPIIVMIIFGLKGN